MNAPFIPVQTAHSARQPAAVPVTYAEALDQAVAACLSPFARYGRHTFIARCGVTGARFLWGWRWRQNTLVECDAEVLARVALMRAHFEQIGF
jgi:hypothetical protein